MPKNGDGFVTITCLSVLEHVPSTWKVANNLQRLLQPGGSLFLAFPFAFRIHEHPVDCFRFTPTPIEHPFFRGRLKHFEHSDENTAYGSGRMPLGQGRHTKLNRFVSAGMRNVKKSVVNWKRLQAA